MVNLTELTVNPKHLNFNILQHLTNHRLKDLRIVSNCKKHEFYFDAVSEEQWQLVCKNEPRLKVHCYMYVSARLIYEWTNFKTFFKRNMPLCTLVIYGNRMLKNLHLFGQDLCNYSHTLEEFVNFPAINSNSHSNCTGDITIDESIVEVVDNCKKLKTLAVRQLLSAKTIIHIAKHSENLKSLLIQEDDINFCNDNVTLQCTDIGSLCSIVSSYLGFSWKPLTKIMLLTNLKDRYGSYIYNS